MRVLTWNLFHGRAEPPAGRPLLREFSEKLAGWEWDVALLQEVPPWWPPALGDAARAHARTVLTSRNELLPLRRFVAQRWPDAIKSNGGGANAILVRGMTITDHRRQVLRRVPERRVTHGVELDGGVWIVNMHTQAHSFLWAQADIDLAARSALAWARGGRILLGGDLNHFRPKAEGFVYAGGHHVDHLLAHRMRVTAPARTLPHAPLSDHAPVVIGVEPTPD